MNKIWHSKLLCNLVPIKSQNVAECSKCHRVLQNVTECRQVLQSAVEYRKVSSSVAGCCRVSQGIAGCRRVSQSVAECYRVLQSVAECRRVSQSVVDVKRSMFCNTLRPMRTAALKCYDVLRHLATFVAEIESFLFL